jgi:hypothetical protein
LLPTSFAFGMFLKHAWLQQSFKKIVNPMVHWHTFKAMGDVMYIRGIGVYLTQTTIETNALNQLCKVWTNYPSIKPIFYYVNVYWVPKVSMWCIGVRNIQYANQDTNATIEVIMGFWRKGSRIWSASWKACDWIGWFISYFPTPSFITSM